MRLSETTIVLCVDKQENAPPYVEALAHCSLDGEVVEVVTPAEGRDDLEEMAAGAAGLVLAGGPDMEPWRYGEEPRPDASLNLVPELDELEWRLLTGAQAARTPVWAICRGLQTLNVFLGGTLWQDLPTQLPETADHYVKKPLDCLAHEIESVDRECELGDRLAGDEVRVNTRHHQALKDVAPSLRTVALSPDGVVEAVEGGDGWWLRGVQWHPENLLAEALQRRLWQDFLATALGRAAGQAAP